MFPGAPKPASGKTLQRICNPSASRTKHVTVTFPVHSTASSVSKMLPEARKLHNQPSFPLTTTLNENM